MGVSKLHLGISVIGFWVTISFIGEKRGAASNAHAVTSNRMSLIRRKAAGGRWKSMSNSVRILSISDDDGLRYSRELLLLNDGYEIESIASTAPLSVSRARSFDMAVICRSVERERAMALADMLRRYNPEMQILCISPLENQLDGCAADLEIPSGPEVILEAVRLMSTQKSMHKAYEASHQR